MGQFFSDASRPVCVAVAFDDNASKLMTAAANFAEKVGSSLLVVHVTEPWVGAAGMGILPVPEITNHIQDELRQKAETRLGELAESITNVKVTTVVRIGVVADEVIDVANEHKAKVILTGHVSKERSFIPAGFSSVLGILGNSHVPVLALSETQPMDAKRGKLKVLLADDLSDEGFPVVKGAYDFAASLNAELKHLHVNSIAKDTLEGALAAATAAGKGTSEKSLTGEEYFSALQKAIRNKVAQREADARKSVGADDVSSEVIVRDGHPDEEMEKAVEDLKPDLIIFGRHKTLHFKPFLIGRVPFKAMLNLNCSGVMVIPPEF